MFYSIIYPPPPRSGLKLRFLIAFIAALALAGCFSSVFEPNYTLGIKGKNTTGDAGAGTIPEAPSPEAPGTPPGDPGSAIVPVTDITGVPIQAYAKLGPTLNSLTLGGTVEPADATNQTITWSVKTDDGTSSAITGSTFSAVDDGTVTVTATIADGLAAGTPYTQDFTIDVKADYVPGVGIIGRASIPNGTFTMGDIVNLVGGYNMHQVTLTKDFYMGKYEVTQAQFEAVMGRTQQQLVTETIVGSLTGVGDDYPVYWVRWYAAIAFCNKLSLMAGLEPVYTVTGISDWGNLTYAGIPKTKNENWDKVVMDRSKSGYRLPTDAEWVYAARAGTTTTWYNGDTESDGLGIGAYAWYNPNSGGSAHPVGQKLSNAFGLHDMYGNIGEWVWDWMTSPITAHETDPTGNPNLAGTTQPRAIRGGNRISTAALVNNAMGSYSTGLPQDQVSNTGFRVVRVRQ